MKKANGLLVGSRLLLFASHTHLSAHLFVTLRTILSVLFGGYYLCHYFFDPLTPFHFSASRSEGKRKTKVFRSKTKERDIPKKRREAETKTNATLKPPLNPFSPWQ